MRNKKNRIARFATILIIAIVLMLRLSFGFVIVHGDSMANTLSDGQVIVIRRNIGLINRGDIVVVLINNKEIVKRVCAVCGDKVELRDGKVFVNDIRILPYNYEGEDKNIVIKTGEVFLVGDNYYESYDSRSYAQKKKKNVIGIMIIII